MFNLVFVFFKLPNLNFSTKVLGLFAQQKMYFGELWLNRS